MVMTSSFLSISIIVAIAVFRRSAATTVGLYSGVDAIMSEFSKIRDNYGPNEQPVSVTAKAPTDGKAGGRHEWDALKRLCEMMTDERTNTDTVTTTQKNGQPDDIPCLSFDGQWLSSNLNIVFQVTVTDTVGRLDLRAVGSDWTGIAEALFGTKGPLTGFIRHNTDTGTAATFVGHCRVVKGVDTITGIWVLALQDKYILDYHLAVQPIPDTLHRLNVG